MTLREQVTDAIRLNLELIDHIEHAFTPKVQEMRRLSRDEYSDPEKGVSDKAIRNSSATVLESDYYTRKLYDKLKALTDSISDSLTEISEHGQ
ncbi:hypothetical protein [Calycomorphotria hydatis]|uniref:Uncharacterized protein n=1 Tax=Calycomorphotria hydatis TaxID=2528027 RepID=A0A517TB23_9PLAN|nr:hypothetical protein [Calycomorphotria hydatis]QDT65566.1 hypothetical protein V22_28210 [Calycomorphotria hydatis]